MSTVPQILRSVYRFLKPFFEPAPFPKGRPKADEGAGMYIRSFLFLRLMIGFLGVTLPFTLVFFDWLAFSGDPVPRGSMSIYYYSGMREVFTVTLGTIAFFLFAYKFTEKNLDNTLSIVAGLAGMTIPLFPTGRPRGVHPLPSLTPLQNLIGEDWTKYIHYGASAIFIASLGGICVLFGRRERKRPEHGNVLPARFWQGWHFVCAGAIVVAAIWIVVTTWFVHGPYWSLLVGEGVSAVAFGASWFVKGAEIRYLFGHDEPTAPGQAEASA